MFRMVLMTQWKWSRLALGAATVAAFALPILSVQTLGSQDTSWLEGRRVLDVMRGFAGWYALLALGAGLAVGMSAWAADHRGRHVYALSLPIPRWRLVLLRFGAGATLLLVPCLALWVGAMVATASIQIPPGLESYAGAMAVRFTLSILLTFAAFFAISSGTPRTAGWVLGVLGAILLFLIVGSSLGMSEAAMREVEALLLTFPGGLEIFTGSWMLIDV